MDIKAYLERINYDGAPAPTARTLRDLQIAHLIAVPFENLSIHLSEPIVLSDDALFEKVVRRRRGGFCYELNGLFAALLRALGFEVIMLSAEVANGEAVFGPKFDHMALLVTLDERWLVDVGFGDSFRAPLLLDERQPQVQGNSSYRIAVDGDRLTLAQNIDQDKWKPQYRFSLQPYEYSDYAEMCHYHQTSSESHFTQARICSRATPEGRLTLSDMRFIITEANGQRQEKVLQDNDEYATVLREDFGIVIRRSYGRD